MGLREYLFSRSQSAALAVEPRQPWPVLTMLPHVQASRHYDQIVFVVLSASTQGLDMIDMVFLTS